MRAEESPGAPQAAGCLKSKFFALASNAGRSIRSARTKLVSWNQPALASRCTATIPCTHSARSAGRASSVRHAPRRWPAVVPGGAGLRAHARRRCACQSHTASRPHPRTRRMDSLFRSPHHPSDHPWFRSKQPKRANPRGVSLLCARHKATGHCPRRPLMDRWWRHTQPGFSDALDLEYPG
jgi:hypothetical protein